MGAIYARLIYKNVTFGIDTGYSKLSDVKPQYQEATAAAYIKIYHTNVPE